MTRLALTTLAIASVCYVMPATAEEVGVHVGPAPGVVVHGDRDREKTVIEKRGPVEDKTIIKKDHPDGSSEKTIIHHDQLRDISGLICAGAINSARAAAIKAAT